MISTDILIVGSGFSGLDIAIKLRAAGRNDFVIIEKADDVGGTWRDNDYPGAECDIQSHMYSFSHELNKGWSREFSAQPEIFEYMRKVAAKHGLYDAIHFDTEWRSAAWDEQRRRWTVTTSKETYDARILVSGIGGLHIPNIPTLEGAEDFTGARFHSAQWDHSVDLTGKRVAVIGTGASAIQFIPQIAPEVAQLDVYQRTAPWTVPKLNHDIVGRKARILKRIPFGARAYRTLIYTLNEAGQVAFTGPFQRVSKVVEDRTKAYIRRTVDDPEVAEKLIPDYRFGCKRVLRTDNYIKTYNRDNVELVTTGIDRIESNGVRDVDGTLREADVIIYGTGFHVTDAFDWVKVSGVGGRDLSATFRDEGIETYLGIAVRHFPNFFFMLGPNTALGHNSVVFMIEQQSHWILKMLDELDEHKAAAAQPTASAQRSFNQRLQAKVSKGVWSQGGCTSWYLDRNGENRTIWPGFTWRYWLATRSVKTKDFSWDRVG